MLMIDAKERRDGLFSEWTSGHNDIVETMNLLCLSYKMSASGVLVPKVAEVDTNPMVKVTPVLGRIEMTNTCCDGKFHHGRLQSHD